MMCSDSPVGKQEDGVLSDSAVGIGAVEADKHSAGKERASVPVTAVVVSVAGGGRASLHVTGSSPMSKRKVTHARGVVNKARGIDLSAHFKRVEPATVNGGAGRQQDRAVDSSHSTSMCSFVSLIAQSGFSMLSVSVSD